MATTDEAEPEIIVPPGVREEPARQTPEGSPKGLVPARGALAISRDQREWTEEQKAALLAMSGLAKVPDPVLTAFLHICQITDLDPMIKQIYLVPHTERTKRNGQWTETVRWTPITGIDGYRKIARRGGDYQLAGPMWCGDDEVWHETWNSTTKGPPVACRVGILRDGHPAPFWGVVHYDEYVPLKQVYENNKGTGEWEPTATWKKRPSGQLSKCSEALAIRMAFPAQTAGVYVEEEMEHVQARAAAEAETERARQRADVARPWATRPAGDGKVIDHEPDQPGTGLPPREDLLAELAWQCEVLGGDVYKVCRRNIATFKKNPDQWSDEELAQDVVGRRALVTAAVAELPADDPRRTGPSLPSATPSDGPVGEAAAGPPTAPDGEPDALFGAS